MRYPTIASAILAISSPAAAQSVFDGTWKADTETAQFGGKPLMRSLKDGTFTCSSCSPAWSVEADGAFHPIKGQPYTDAVAVTVIDPNTVNFAYQKDGVVDGEDSMTVSPDGQSIRITGVDRSATSGTPVSYDNRQTRVAPAPAGAHAISGGWRNQGGGSISDAALTVTFKSQGDMMTISYPTGETVTARFGGPAATVSGDKGNSTVKLARINANSFTVTTSRDGKVMSVATLTAQPDGRTLTYTNENKQNGATSRFIAIKQ